MTGWERFSSADLRGLAGAIRAGRLAPNAINLVIGIRRLLRVSRAVERCA